MREKWIRGSRNLAALAAAAAVLAACGGGASSSTPSGASGELDPTAVLRVTASAPTRNLDPYLQTSYGGWGYLTPVFDRLTVVDGEGNLQPGLAESWEFAPDGSYLELKLRRGVVFHDGAPFDAAAVAANIQRGKTMEGSTVVAALKNITNVEVVDDHTVRLRLAPGTGVELPGVFSSNVGMMVSPTAIAAGADLRNNPGQAGSGAYVVTAYVPEESVTLARAEGTNWDPEAGKVAGIEFKWVADASTRLNGIKTGATDLSWVSSANEVVEAGSLSKSGTLDVTEVPFRNVLGLYMRPQGDLAKPEVRQAVASAIDPAAIGALFSDTCTPNRQLYPAGSWSADESYQYPYQFDLEKAKSLVQAAGGAKVTLTFAAGTNTEKPANVIQSTLSQAGIDAELNPVPNTQNEPRYIAGDFQSMVANSFSPKVDPAETVNYFLTGSYDLANGNPQIKELAAKAADPTLPEEDRAPLYNQIWDLTLKEAMFVPICNQTNATVSTAKVVGTEDMPWVNLGIFDVRHVGMTK
ncbi:peptide ABC transporter substrate-binding protein [Prescottella agglutinans]|uniref:Peptide ABC transporter substrate-binding protein n=1 Tax=Prescottella agglutinans TaxID=1644129 RepID=A0A3S3AKT2_9NOCA|nr:ABC transporter substrate-binding protein [Prescottella agglutinans]RVW07059.1 peptide ABC transporter substrate-binding protein [Prescottella agglutinans]